MCCFGFQKTVNSSKSSKIVKSNALRGSVAALVLNNEFPKFKI